MLTDRAGNNLNVAKGRKTSTQQQQQFSDIHQSMNALSPVQSLRDLRRAMNVRKMNNQTNEILNIHKLYTLRLSMKNLFSNE